MAFGAEQGRSLDLLVPSSRLIESGERNALCLSPRVSLSAPSLQHLAFPVEEAVVTRSALFRNMTVLRRKA